MVSLVEKSRSIWTFFSFCYKYCFFKNYSSEIGLRLSSKWILFFPSKRPSFLIFFILFLDTVRIGLASGSVECLFLTLRRSSSSSSPLFFVSFTFYLLWAGLSSYSYSSSWSSCYFFIFCSFIFFSLISFFLSWAFILSFSILDSLGVPFS